LADRGRDVWLAGLGALATVEEEGSKLFARLVERGKEYENLSAKQVKELTERVSEQQKKAIEQAEETTTAAQSAVANTMDKALERFGVPTRSEVTDLSEKVDLLSKQIDKLSKNLEEEAQ
jgi:poly(hydroxyalkanoate) granule-associated protein